MTEEELLREIREYTNWELDAEQLYSEEVKEALLKLICMHELTGHHTEARTGWGLWVLL